MKTRLFAWLLVLTVVDAHAADFGRLFTSAQERSNLDTLRRNSQPSAMKERPEPQAMPTLQPMAVLTDAPVHVQGYVQRSDGKKATIWVNQHAMQEGSNTEAIQVGKLGASQQGIMLRLPHTGKKLQLKPGQVYDPQQDRVSEAVSTGNLPAASTGKAANPDKDLSALP